MATRIVMAVVMLGWIFFRLDSLNDALRFVWILIGQTTADATSPPFQSDQAIRIGALFLVAVLLSGGLYRTFSNFWNARFDASVEKAQLSGWVKALVILPLLIIDMMMLALGHYNPFIYFRF